MACSPAAAQLTGVKSLEELFELHPDKKACVLKHPRQTLDALTDKVCRRR